MRSYSEDGQKILVAVLWLVMAACLVAAIAQLPASASRDAYYVGAIAFVVVGGLGLRVRLDVDEAGLVVVGAVRSTRLTWAQIAGFETATSNGTGGRCLGIRLIDGKLRRSRAIAGWSDTRILVAIAELEHDRRRAAGVADPAPNAPPA